MSGTLHREENRTRLDSKEMIIPEKMKAIRYHETGAPSVMRLEEVPVPKIQPDQVLVKIEAAGVNFSDIGKRRDLYLEPTQLPHVPGSEICGQVVRVGREVQGMAIGDRVVGIFPERSGGYAQYGAIAATHCNPIPAEISDESAVALTNQGLTALHILKTMARVGDGETVLVSAAGGGVGGLAIQLAKSLGAGCIVAMASTQEKRESAKYYGADLCYDPEDPEWPAKLCKSTGEDRPVDVALDSLGGWFFDQARRLLSSFGQIIVYGVASGVPNTILPMSLMRGSHSVRGFHLDDVLANTELFRSSLNTLFECHSRGKLMLPIAAKYALENSADAHVLMENRRAIGKLVVQPWR